MSIIIKNILIIITVMIILTICILNTLFVYKCYNEVLKKCDLSEIKSEFSGVKNFNKKIMEEFNTNIMLHLDIFANVTKNRFSDLYEISERAIDSAALDENQLKTDFF